MSLAGSLPCSAIPASLYLDLTVYKAAFTQNLFHLSSWGVGCIITLFCQIGSERLGGLSKVTQQVIDRAWTPPFSRVLWASPQAWEPSSSSPATQRSIGAAPMQTWWVEWVDIEGLPESFLLVL